MVPPTARDAYMDTDHSARSCWGRVITRIQTRLVSLAAKITPETALELQIVAINLVLGCASAGVLLLSYWAWWPQPPRFEVIRTQLLTPVIVSGEALGVRRVFRVNEPGGVADVDREVRSVDGTISTFLPSTGRNYEVREYDTTTYTMLPALPPGEYEIRLVVEYQQNPIKKVRYVAPVERFRVVK